MVTVLFISRKSPFDWAIRKFTWSEYSHVEKLCNDNLTIGANAFGGVKISRFENICKSSSKLASVEYPANFQLGFDWAKSQLGEKYDWGGVLGFPFRSEKWANDGKWFCSEFVYKFLSIGGYTPYREGVHNRITPQDLFKLNFKITKIK